jgi:membrane protein
VYPRVSINDCKRAFARWSDHNAARLGASLAFYTLLSLAPLLLFAVTMVAIVFGRHQAQTWILQQVMQLMGSQGAATAQEMFRHAPKGSSGFVAGTIGTLTLLFGASGVFGELREGLNIAWDLQKTTSSSWKQMAQSRLFSFGMVLAIGFILLVSLMLSTVLAGLIRFFSQLIPFPPPLLVAGNFLISIYVIAGLFALIFRYVPDVHLPIRDLWSGALFTSLLFTLGKVLLGLYLGMASVGSAYGAAGSLVAVVVWVYYSAQIFYFGVEVTWVLTLSNPSRRQESQTNPSIGGFAKSAEA